MAFRITAIVLPLSLCVSAPCRAEPATEEAQSVSLTTTDGLVLQCLFYPGAANKETIPIILLHGWEGPRGAGSGRDFDSLAATLQSAGHAVIFPDLRGHGGSTMRRHATGTTRAFYRDQLGPRDLEAMVRFDVEEVKQFLIRRHNAGQLNIELLCVVGAEMGAAVAANWAVQDWSWPILPNLKQGQDVRALVLISPPQSFRNLSVQKALNFGRLRGIPTMIIYGEQDSDASRDANRIHKQVQKYHLGGQTLYLVGFPTTLQGSRLLGAKLGVDKRIAEFVEARLASQRGRFPWRSRSSN